MESNPEVIQDGCVTAIGQSPQAIPAFLIHDGGGTTFSYHCLEPLGRFTYGIFNPYFGSGERFEGGIRGMARLYADIIRRTCLEAEFPAKRNPDGTANVLVGGWSMGGLLSLEVAKVLTGDSDVRVVGVLMVDSMYTVDPPSVRLESWDSLDLGHSKNEFLSLQAMKEAVRVIHEWKPPVWSGQQAELRPRISLVRALDAIPTSNSDRIHFADVYRHDRALGWDRYEKDMFAEVLEVRGDHFEMFNFKNIPEVSTAIQRCFDRLEVMDDYQGFL
ncbi:polyketide synthase [Apiospora hydei]|uniref:Polyketide synthase n=1 Tax=Apiospora hydei TaxID=1337664 RepID=A0ABR1VWQ9_9PEZI